jgi:hypothetical protein
MIHLSIDTGQTGEIFERDFQGNWIESKHSKTINIKVASELSIDPDPLAFLIVVKIDKTITHEYAEAVSLARHWLAHELPRVLTESGSFNFFNLRWMSPPASISELPRTEPWKPLDKIPVEPNEAMRRCIDEAASHLALVREPFEAAKKKLQDYAYNNTAYGFKHTVGQAHTLLRGIERVLSCSAEFYGSTPEHARRAARDYQELSKRQVESNTNYQYMLRDLQRFTSMLSFPRVWGEKPAHP